LTALASSYIPSDLHSNSVKICIQSTRKGQLFFIYAITGQQEQNFDVHKVELNFDIDFLPMIRKGLMMLLHTKKKTIFCFARAFVRCKHRAKGLTLTAD
jgi:hypothetical protein